MLLCGTHANEHAQSSISRPSQTSNGNKIFSLGPVYICFSPSPFFFEISFSVQSECPKMSSLMKYVCSVEKPTVDCYIFVIALVG
jgi:hypothetical protein